MKRAHTLHLCKSSEEVISYLQIIDLSIAQLLSEVSTNPSSTGLILVGSIPDGLGTNASDIDMFAIVPERSDIRTDVPSFQAYGGSDGTIAMFKIVQEGLELDVEVFSESAYLSLNKKIQSLVTTFYEGTGVFTTLSQAETNFLYLLRNGWVLSNPDVIGRIRKSFATDLLPIYLAIASYIFHLEYREDAIAQRTSDTQGAAATAVRLSAEYATGSALALLGQSNVTAKWIPHKIDRAIREHPKAEPLLLLLRETLFPQPQLEHCDELIRKLEIITAEIEGLLERDQKIAKVSSYIRSQFAYLI